MLVFGTLPKICYAEGMTSYLYSKQVRIFDYPRFAEPFRDQLRHNAERLASGSGIEIEFLRKRNWAEGGPGEGDPGPARRASRAGLHLLGHGALLDLQALARQAERRDIPAAGRRQVPALLLLFHRR